MADEPTIPPDEITRDLRKQLYLSTALDAALADVKMRLGAELSLATEIALKGVLHLHLARAFDEGCLREVDLRTAVITQRATIDTYKKINRALLRRISRER